MPEQPSSFQELKRASRWLHESATDVTSQNGEDGVLAKALSLLPGRNRWCVEFGAWDGRQFSNTYNLVDREAYRVVLIEPDPYRYRQLCSTYPYKERAILINRYVGWSEEDGLDHILAAHPVPPDFDLLSIDIDGNDYHVWQAANKYKPKLVLIEYNLSMANAVEFVQRKDSACCQGSSAAAIVRLARDKGYELIAVTEGNLLFVDRQYFSVFHIPDNSIEVMRDDGDVGHVFSGYDGTVFVRHGRFAGAYVLPWQYGCRLPQRQVQVLPRFLRRYPPAYNWLQWLFFRFVRAWNLLLYDRKGFFAAVRRHLF